MRRDKEFKARLNKKAESLSDDRQGDIDLLRKANGEMPTTFKHLVVKLADQPYKQEYKTFEELMKEGEEDGES